MTERVKRLSFTDAMRVVRRGWLSLLVGNVIGALVMRWSLREWAVALPFVLPMSFLMSAGFFWLNSRPRRNAWRLWWMVNHAKAQPLHELSPETTQKWGKWCPRCGSLDTGYDGQVCLNPYCGERQYREACQKFGAMVDAAHPAKAAVERPPLL
jgi:hypothetical protein